MKNTLEERRGILNSQYSEIIRENGKNTSEFAGTNQKLLEENFDSVKKIIGEFLGALENGVSTQTSS